MNATQTRTLHTNAKGHALAGDNDSVLVQADNTLVVLGVNTFGFPGASNSWNYSHMTAADARQVAALLNAAADRAELA